MISKKADGLEINVIIIAALCLIVLVVLLAIFSSRMQTGIKGQEDQQNSAIDQICSSSKKECVRDSQIIQNVNDNCVKNSKYIDCPNDGWSCCDKVN